MDLPVAFVKSYKWLNYLAKSQLFAYVWQKYEVNKINYNSVIVEIMAEWRDLFERVTAKNILFSELRLFADILTSPDEWRLFSTSRAFTADTKFHTDTETFENYCHTIKTIKNKKKVIENVKILSSFVHQTGQHSMRKVLKLLESLEQTYLTKQNWSLSELGILWEYSSQISPVLVNLDTAFLHCLVESGELLDWLRARPDDSDFTYSIEIAMGKNEIECPAELWTDGRVNEQVLSRLNNVRSYLHQIIFRKHEYVANLGELVEVFNNSAFYTSQPLQHCVESMKNCNLFRIPIVELLSSTSYVDKLIRMYENNDEFVIDGEISLKTSTQRFNMADLADFQSQIVLSKSKNEAIIHRFIQRFADIQQLHLILRKLAENGYKDNSVYRIPLCADLPELAEKMAFLDRWLAHIKQIRQGAVNFLNIYQIADLIDFNDPFKPISVDAPTIRRVPFEADIENFPQPVAKNNIRFIVTGKDIFNYVLSEYVRIGRLPEREFVFICYPNSTTDDIYRYILLWESIDIIIVGINRLTVEKQRILAATIRERKSNNVLLLFSTEQNIYFNEYKSISVPVPVPKIPNVYVYSSLSGAGKSFDIRALNERYTKFRVNRPMDAAELVEKVKFSPGTFHFDMAIDGDFDYLFFELIFLGNLVYRNKQCIWDRNDVCICIEIPNQQIYDSLTICKYLNNITSHAKNFKSDAESVKWVYSALRYVEVGAFPNDFELFDIGPDCYELLLKYSGLTQNSSLWCIWNFINVTYWQLQEMHHPESLIHAMCLYDPTSLRKLEKENKQKLKCELFVFMLKTSREYAMCQVAVSKKDQISGYQIDKFTRPDLNGIWKRCDYESDGKPCFKFGLYYLYYRIKKNIWVIDDTIQLDGSYYAMSEDMITWRRPNNWKEQDFTVKIVKNLEGFDNLAVEISGIIDIPGAGVSSTENGIYLCQPDKINNECHYIKQNPRRHLFWCNTSKLWILAPICNIEEGAYAISNTKILESKWRAIAGDIIDMPEIKPIFYTDDRPEELLKWNELNHECILFSNENHILHFVSANDSALKASMHPIILSKLAEHDAKLEISNFEDVIKSLVGKKRPNIMSDFCLTRDGMLKMLAIYIRIKCKIPVILMGEAGIGKTYILSYLCAWLGIKLRILDVHGGTSENDLISAFDVDFPCIVFLDEINTCAHMGLFTEIILYHSINGRKIPEFVQVVSALNPHRVKSTVSEVGLIYDINIDDPMKNLVYRVYKVPETLQAFVFDFGELTDEFTYAKAMCDKSDSIIHTIIKAQKFIRKVEKDISAVSLRDIRRCIDLMKFFEKDAEFLAIAFVYYFRLADETVRAELLAELKIEKSVIDEAKAKFVQNFKIDADIAMNNALSENLFVLTVCILNKIPVFLVGSPGTSKTLALQIIVNNLQGKKSANHYWHQYPTICLFQYQCSPLSSSESILQQFNTAKNYQIHCHDTITILLLDEIGLAEYSPDLPLKVLHGMLVNPPIAIVGLSNWTLDAAKMNRAILIQRTRATNNEIYETGKQILGDGPLLQKLSTVYAKICEEQAKHRAFFGMRDYYSLLKQLRQYNWSSATPNSKLNFVGEKSNCCVEMPQQLNFAPGREFTGQ